MSVSVTVKAFDRGATAAVTDLLKEISPRKFAATVGPRLREQTRDHLKQLPRNRKGWPSTGFWEQAARATRYEIGAGDVKIIVNKIGVRQRYLGGTIEPVNKDALTIPISPLSYGKTVADFPGSFILHTPKGAYIVRYGDGGATQEVSGTNPGVKPERRRRRAHLALRATLVFLFKLVGSVTQKPNPDVMPTAAEFKATVFAAARERLTAIRANKGVATT